MITQDDLNEVIAQAVEKGLSESLVSELRDKFSYHFTYCIDDDMDNYTPAVECEGFNIYFVNSSNHCSVLTRDRENASGMVLAEVIDDE